MNFIVTAEQMKEAEVNAGLKGLAPLVLMENAAKECFKKISELVDGVEGKMFVILCGRGNNGGDGIVLSALLKENGGDTLCIFVSDLPDSETARLAYTKYHERIDFSYYGHREETVKKALLSCDVIVDCVFGSGFHGALEQKIAELFSYINSKCRTFEMYGNPKTTYAAPPARIAIDLPSGVNATTGQVSEGAFKADCTLVLGAAKTGLFSRTAAEQSGGLILLNIGIPNSCYTNFTATITGGDITRFIPKRPVFSHKGNYGKLLNISGSARYTGAALLSTKSALKSGVGLATLAAPAAVCLSIAPAIPEAVFSHLPADDKGFINAASMNIIADELSKATVVAIGSGLGTTADTAKVTEFVIKNAKCPIVLDADGINSIAPNINMLRDNDKLKIITPHAAEFARLISVTVEEVEQNRIKLAAHYARETLSIIVLKGANTVIASPDGRVGVNPTGNPGLAKGGAGDVLTGIIASFVAQGVPGYEAALLGTYLHGLAAERLSKSVSLAGIMPCDIAEYLPFVMNFR
ncbi:MAG: NAD(P)H-hydrate dehydratase [Oscillospiraceae bacterium]|nr:NAD(P)H-hydrate dehydratase [Oscillospiraceae bacterium]